MLVQEFLEALLCLLHRRLLIPVHLHPPLGFLLVSSDGPGIIRRGTAGRRMRRVSGVDGAGIPLVAVDDGLCFDAGICGVSSATMPNALREINARQGDIAGTD
jgi:hypothetical protein